MSKNKDARALVAMLVLGGVAALLFTLGGTELSLTKAAEIEAPALFGGDSSCTLSGELARARALEAERAASARWERVPYSLSEGAAAVTLLAEAGACFRACADRGGRSRADSNLTVWKRELDRLYARSRLTLTLALRKKDHQAAAVEAKTLLALLAKLDAKADPYRSFLKNVERASRAAAIEQLRAKEEK